jgi:hypothetical protein
MSESWQDWRDPAFREFLDAFYKEQLRIAGVIADNVKPSEHYAVMLAVFEKVAPPAVYLKAEYDAWRKREKVVKPIKDKLEEITSKTPWRDSKNNPAIEWCPAQEALASDVDKAEKKEDNMWYLPPRNGYAHGSIFRRKEPQK